MKTIQEITDWGWPNHTYFVSDNREKLYAYVKSVGDGSVDAFKNPIPFNTRGRKFREVPNIWNYQATEAPSENSAEKTWHVAGSGGDTHTVSLTQGRLTCTCAGFRFRSRCRHTQDVAQELTN